MLKLFSAFSVWPKAIIFYSDLLLSLTFWLPCTAFSVTQWDLITASTGVIAAYSSVYVGVCVSVCVFAYFIYLFIYLVTCTDQSIVHLYKQ